MVYLVVSAVAALLGLGMAVYYAFLVLRQDVGTPEMAEISRSIQQGAMAFLKREYTTVAFVLVAVALLMAFWLGQPVTAAAYVFGAALSGTAGLVGLTIATRANARTTNAARKSLGHALLVAFRGGSVMGLTVAGLGLLGISLCFIVFYYVFDLKQPALIDIIPGFGLGASTIALFARVGGGIYTKAADVGADLVGKCQDRQGRPGSVGASRKRERSDMA